MKHLVKMSEVLLNDARTEQEKIVVSDKEFDGMNKKDRIEFVIKYSQVSYLISTLETFINNINKLNDEY